MILLLLLLLLLIHSLTDDFLSGLSIECSYDSTCCAICFTTQEVKHKLYTIYKIFTLSHLFLDYYYHTVHCIEE